MARPTKIRDAKTAADYRDAVVERYRKIRRRLDPLPPFESPDQPLPPPRRERAAVRSGGEPRRFSFGSGLSREGDDDGDE